MMTDSTVVRIEALWYRLSGIHKLVVHNTQGMVVHALLRIRCFLEQCMSRPYPVGEMVAGHKLASLYIIITMLAGCTKADFIVSTGKLGTKRLS